VLVGVSREDRIEIEEARQKMYVPFLPTNNHTTAQLFSGDSCAFLFFVLSKGTTPRKQNTAEQKQADKKRNYTQHFKS